MSILKNRKHLDPKCPFANLLANGLLAKLAHMPLATDVSSETSDLMTVFTTVIKKREQICSL